MACKRSGVRIPLAPLLDVLAGQRFPDCPICERLPHDLVVSLVTVRYGRWSAACAERLRIRQAVTPGPSAFSFYFSCSQACRSMLLAQGFDLSVLMQEPRREPPRLSRASRVTGRAMLQCEPCLDVRSRSRSG